MISWSGNNRTHMIRIPDPGRFELRLADGAVNPYLLPAAILAVGLDGVRNQRDPGRRLDINMYAEADRAGDVKRLPLNLLDALRAFEASKLFKTAFGGEFVSAYVRLKTESWNDYMRHLTKWELETTLDC